MHEQNNKISALCFGNNEFNNSLNEIKEHLGFNLTFLQKNEIIENISNYNTIIIHEDVLKNKNFLKSLNKLSLIKILIFKKNNFEEVKFDEKIGLPISIKDFNKKIIELNTKKNFSINSSVQIKNYILDKNEKKLKKQDKFIIITEKEIQLLELLFSEKKPVKKKKILETIWKYSSDADTHTVETHIYRLRKKVIDKFEDDSLIVNNKNGYKI
tara:strand:+ start:434 stop:1072 length:639 start_codon:yes stop_codon:yes gene_type:complete